MATPKLSSSPDDDSASGDEEEKRFFGRPGNCLTMLFKSALLRFSFPPLAFYTRWVDDLSKDWLTARFSTAARSATVNERNWVYLLDLAPEGWHCAPEFAAAAIRLNYTRVLARILDRAAYPPVVLKRLANFSVSNADTLRVLLHKHGWLAKTHTTQFDTLVHYAVRNKAPHFGSLLEIPEIRANLDALDASGNTPLMAACRRRFGFRKLVLAGADLKIVHHVTRNTVLHSMASSLNNTSALVAWFVRWARPENAHRLPNLEIRNISDATPLQLALLYRRISLARCLKNLGASVDSVYMNQYRFSTTDLMFLRCDAKSLALCRAMPSVPRILHAYVDGHLDNWVINFKGDCLYRRQRDILCKAFGFPTPPFDKNKAIEFLSTGSFRYNSREGEPENRDDCSICFESLGDRHHVTHCSHRFHSPCFEKWLREHDRKSAGCPLCRAAGQAKSVLLLETRAPPPFGQVEVSVSKPRRKRVVGETVSFLDGSGVWVREEDL